ncbi:class I SAM-dependent methyltransferase [Azorhizobium doebereinerae]|uniref:class I SAM-dependent methyltransferase n=1 Tax=Azorhizobium doebereinerae TaxID=281091 RepID=UPI0004137CA5|nr:class I SAM-dependent methyltransferase [Azorhizobium doebereinerae]
MLSQIALEDDIELDFRSLDEWLAWFNANTLFGDDRHTDQVRQASIRSGLEEPLTGRRFAAGEIHWDPANYRETGLAGGLTARHRGTLYALKRCFPQIDKYETRIYCSEALTEFALLMRGTFPKFIGTEYATTQDEERWLFPIPHADLTALSYPAETFDLAITNEVLEHVPSLDQALAEICRVLRPGGWHVGTCPFVMMQSHSIVKSKLQDGRIIHLMEPEYHGNPMSAEGSLVFEIPGWDILERARAIGFSDAFWKFIQSERHGIASNGCGGIFVLCLQR